MLATTTVKRWRFDRTPRRRKVWARAGRFSVVMARGSSEASSTLTVPTGDTTAG